VTGRLLERLCRACSINYCLHGVLDEFREQLGMAPDDLLAVNSKALEYHFDLTDEGFVASLSWGEAGGEIFTSDEDANITILGVLWRVSSNLSDHDRDSGSPRYHVDVNFPKSTSGLNFSRSSLFPEEIELLQQRVPSKGVGNAVRCIIQPARSAMSHQASRSVVWARRASGKAVDAAGAVVTSFKHARQCSKDVAAAAVDTARKSAELGARLLSPERPKRRHMRAKTAW